MVIMLHSFLIENARGEKRVIKSRLLDFATAEDTSIARTVALPAAIAVKMILENSVKMGQIKDDKMGYINSYIDSHKKGDTKFLETAIYSDVNLFIGLEIEGLSKDTVSAMKDYKLNSLVKDMTNSYKMSEKDVTKANETIRRIKSLPLDKINAKNLKDKEDAEKILQNNATSGQIFGEIFQSFYDDYSATQKAKAA
jgi:hypothetical protein